MSLIREVMAQLEATVPEISVDTAARLEEDFDEVLSFERVVDKVTMLITRSAHQAESNNVSTPSGMWSMWMDGRATPTSRRRSSADFASGRRTSTKTVFSMNSEESGALSIASDALGDVGLTVEAVDSWNLDFLSLDHERIHAITSALLFSTAERAFALDPEVGSAFIDRIEEKYNDACPYHNWMHAADTHFGVFRECNIAKVAEFTPRMELFALHVAAIAHDVGHPGLNNVFLVSASHELALRYNDVSPLENMHCSVLFSIVSSSPGANIFRKLNDSQFKDARRICIETILHTDNVHHFEMVKEMQLFYHAHSDTMGQSGVEFPTAAEVEVFKQGANRRLVLNTLLHGADISNACKPWNICQQWADRVLGEFFLQGDKERELGIPMGMLNDREKVNRPSSQVAFIDFFVAPFNSAHVQILPPLWELTVFLRLNLQRWHSQCQVDVKAEDESKDKRVQALCDQLYSVTEAARKRTATAPNRTEARQHGGELRESEEKSLRATAASGSSSPSSLLAPQVMFPVKEST